MGLKRKAHEPYSNKWKRPVTHNIPKKNSSPKKANYFGSKGNLLKNGYGGLGNWNWWTEALFKIFDFTPGNEISIVTGCKFRNNERDAVAIWDILGSYNPKDKLVKICEIEIDQFFEDNKKDKALCRLEKKQTRYSIRELIRIHEHVHSLIHHFNFFSLGGVSIGLDSFPPAKSSTYKIPDYVEEPLCVFISFSIIKTLNWIAIGRIFNILDKKTPQKYQNWIKIREIVERNINRKLMRDYIYFTPSLIKIAREKNYSSFNEFIQLIENNQKSNSLSKIIFAFKSFI